MRLQRYIAKAGITSRRKAEDLIINGNVKVNGKVIKELGTKVSGNDIVVVNGVEIEREAKVYFLLNKPRAVLSAVSDDTDRKVVVDLIHTDKRIYPVGRLDYNTTGALILTNDGELTNIVSHPSNEVKKTYIAKLHRPLELHHFYKIKDDLYIDDRKVDVLNLKFKNNQKTLIEISINEGRNHIIKNIFESQGYMVDKLTRTHIGFLNVNNLNSGEYRELTIKEVKKLYSYKKDAN